MEPRKETDPMKPGTPLKTILLMLPTVGLFALLVFVALRSRTEDVRAEQLSSRMHRIDLTERMRLALVTASDAERSAVLAVTDEESQTFADQARSAMAMVERLRNELSPLVAAGEPPRGKELLEGFTTAFEEFRKLDSEILNLAVKNTNIKAYGLAHGPAAESVAEMDAALSLLTNNTASSKEVLLSASQSLVGILRIQALLAPHIAEENDQKMDELEARMGREDQKIRQHLDTLAALPQLRGSADVAAIRANYEKYSELRARILKLSRENTNVHSLSLALDPKRARAVAACQDALAALRQAFGETAAIPAAPTNPRHL
jgi:hypothetical protein